MVNFGGLHSHFQSVKMPQIFAAANFGSLHAIYRGSVSRNCLHLSNIKRRIAVFKKSILPEFAPQTLLTSYNLIFSSILTIQTDFRVSRILRTINECQPQYFTVYSKFNISCAWICNFSSQITTRVEKRPILYAYVCQPHALVSRNYLRSSKAYIKCLCKPQNLIFLYLVAFVTSLTIS